MKRRDRRFILGLGLSLGAATCQASTPVTRALSPKCVLATVLDVTGIKSKPGLEIPTLVPDDTRVFRMDLHSTRKMRNWTNLMAYGKPLYFVEDLSGRILLTEHPIAEPKTPYFVVEDLSRNDGIPKLIVKRSGRLLYRKGPREVSHRILAKILGRPVTRTKMERQFFFEENTPPELAESEHGSLLDRLLRENPELEKVEETPGRSKSEELILSCQKKLSVQTSEISFIGLKMASDLGFQTLGNWSTDRFKDARGWGMAKAGYFWTIPHDATTLTLSTLLAKRLPLLPLGLIFYGESSLEPYFKTSVYHYTLGAQDDVDPVTGQRLSQKLSTGDFWFAQMDFPPGFYFNWWLLRRYPSFMMSLCLSHPKATWVFNPIFMRLAEKAFHAGFYTVYTQLRFGKDLKDKPSDAKPLPPQVLHPKLQNPGTPTT